MSFLFGTKATPAELLQQNKRNLNKSIREINVECQKLLRQKEQLTKEIKKSAKQGQMAAVKVMAKDLVRTQHVVHKLDLRKAQLQGLCLRNESLKSTRAMGEAMKAVTQAMTQMNKQMNMPSVQKNIKEYMTQNQKMDMTMDMMEESMEDAFEEDEEAEETEELVNQVLDEIGIEINQELLKAPSSVAPASSSKGKSPQVEAVENENGLDSELQARLDNLRRM